MADARREKLVGVVISMPTFCNDDFEIRWDRQAEHTRWLVSKGIVEGEGVLMGGGGLGEGYFYTEDEFKRNVDVLAEAAEGKVPTMVGIFDLSARVAAKKARYAAEGGIDFVQVAPPHYLPPSDDDVFYHFQYLNDAADIGIMAYNTPWAMPGRWEFRPPLLERMIELEHLDGLKWASYDQVNFWRVLRMFSDRLNFIDNQLIFSQSHRFGMAGFIDFLANAAPRLSLKLWSLLKQKRWDEYDELFTEVYFNPFRAAVAPEHQQWVGVGEGPSGKTTMRVLGLECGPPFPAQAPYSDEAAERTRKALEASGVFEWVEEDVR